MMWTSFLSLFSLLFISSCSGAPVHKRAPANVVWGGCAVRPGSRFQCAVIDVPLDWQDASKGTIPLSVTRLSATKSPRKGYMFVNPGGPGLPGTQFLHGAGPALQAQLGLDWDVLSWDPRGVLISGPSINMFNSDAEYDAFWGQLQGPGNYNTHGNLTIPSDAQFFMSQANKFDNLTIALNNRSIERNGDNLKYIGTCAVTRDLVYLVDSIYGEGSDVNFWGISYGTVIGVYLTQMFPERVGKTIFDGVYDAEKHANLAPMKWLDQDFKGVEAALVKWAEWCATARECQFRTMISTAPEGPSPSSVLTKVKDMLNTAYLGYDGTPVTVNSLSTNEPGIWPYEYLVQRIRTYLYEQSSWTSLESLFRNLERSQTIGSSRSFKNDDDNDDDDDGDDIVKLDSRLATSGPALYAPLLPYLTSYVSYAIYCGDIVDSKGETTQDLFNLTVQAAQSVSPNFASLTPAYSLRSLCHNWKSRAVERLPQPMTKKPKNIVLVIGNTADPATPYESAQRLASSAFFGAQARLVKFDAAGHSSRAAESTCIDGVLSNYVNGNPPADKGNDEEDVVCATTLASFPPSGGTSIDSGAPRMGRQLANNVSLIIAALVGITMFMC